MRAKLNLLQSLISHDPSEIPLKCWFGAQELFILIINFENRFFVFTFQLFLFRIFFIKRTFKRTEFLWTEKKYIYIYIYIYCHKSINFFKIFNNVLLTLKFYSRTLEDKGKANSKIIILSSFIYLFVVSKFKIFLPWKTKNAFSKNIIASKWGLSWKKTTCDSCSLFQV